MDKVQIGVVGCGSVSEKYLPNLRACRYAQIVAVCDLVPTKYRRYLSEYGIGKGFSSIDEMLEGAEFDLLLNLTSMPSHYEINKKGLNAGRNVWSEKPFAPTYEQGRELLDLAQNKGVAFRAAPNAVTSPQFRCMAETIASGRLGRVFAAHACYGHGGPTWGPWFYKKGGGCMGDLAVYNITTLTGLLGPAKSVTALVGTCIGERDVEGERVAVTADDNVMVLLDHGHGVLSHIQAGFVYCHHNEDRTIELIGDGGMMNLLGWDWAPRGVQVRTRDDDGFQTLCTDAEGYVWECGAAQFCEHLATGKPMLMTAEHALHVVDVMESAYRSAETGNRTEVKSSFAWPLV